MITLPDAADVQVATNWPAVDTYRAAYARMLLAVIRVEHYRCKAERTFHGTRSSSPAGRRLRRSAFTRYEAALGELPLLEWAAWELEAEARALGPEVEAALARARQSVMVRREVRAAELAADRARGWV